MRQFEKNDIEKAAAGDVHAQLRVQRRKEVLQFEAWKRRNRVQRAIPAWANKSAIAAIYEQATRLTKETGIPHQVDHIIPIQGKNVCGLHVEHNLQILTKTLNLKKRTHFDPDPSTERDGGPSLTPGVVVEMLPTMLVTTNIHRKAVVVRTTKTLVVVKPEDSAAEEVFRLSDGMHHLRSQRNEFPCWQLCLTPKPGG